MRISQREIENLESSNNNNENNIKNNIIKINWNELLPIQDFEAKTNHLDKKEKREIYKLINTYDSLFAKNRFDIGTVSEYMAHI